MKAVLDKVLGYFKGKKEEVSSIQEEQEQGLGVAFTLVFVTDTAGNTRVLTSFGEQSDLYARAFAQLLLNITEGEMNSTILDTLVDLANKHPVVEPFIENIINKWIELKKTKEELDELPLVMPDQFLATVQKQGDSDE
jgi:hypothetical protein